MSPAASTAREAATLADASPLGDREARRFSPAEAEPRGDEGGGLKAPAARPSWFRRTRATFRNSVWAPVALKLVGLTLAMIALSGFLGAFVVLALFTFATTTLFTLLLWWSDRDAAPVEI